MSDLPSCSHTPKMYNRRRPLEPPDEPASNRPAKRKTQLFEFIVLLPNRTKVTLREEKNEQLTVKELVAKIELLKKDERDNINWTEVYLEDTLGTKIEDGSIFDSVYTFPRTLVLQDGQPAEHSLQDMWNVTPDPELLGALPQEYTFETALADLLDNSLQAVWANAAPDGRLISVTMSENKITIFDSGQGMDGSTSNSIAKWGTMGSSKHRSVRSLAIGGNPPFLKPFFGMYGFGGLVAAMHLAGVAVVSSKTKASKKVVTLTLEKDKLMERCKNDRTWKIPGEFKEPTREDIKKSPHGSFTKVELSKLKKKNWKEHQLMCMLKDIYFPYIQCDISGSCQKTTMPVEFEVNDRNLAEVDGGEVAVTNMFSCNGLPFIIDVKLKKISHDEQSRIHVSDVDRANARITCFYYPIKQGRERIDDILEELERQQIGINESFENFCRVAIRRLGRLLPNARWRRLPFMEPKRRRADKGTPPRVCFERVKAFVDTDAGFVPTTSKMDLSSGHIFTSALRNLGSRGVSLDGVTLEIIRDKHTLTASALEKEYQEWIKEMHESFDDEVDCDDDADVTIVTFNMKELGFSQDVFRVYKHMKRKGVVWKQGMRVKFFKGIPGHSHKDFYATLEYFLSEGLSEDRGNAKVICRPIEVQTNEGSTLILKDNDASFHLGKSIVLSIDLLCPDKCTSVSESDWTLRVEKRSLQCPAAIEILNEQWAKTFGLSGGLKHIVKAGSKPPSEFIAVVRPKQYLKLNDDGKDINPIGQKSIVKQALEMQLDVRYRVGKEPCDECVERSCATILVKGKTINGIQGLYCFKTEGGQFEDIFHKSGIYAFVLSLTEEYSEGVSPATFEVHVLASDKIGHWELCIPQDGYLGNQNEAMKCRLGSKIGPLVMSCFDEFGNVKEINEPVDLRFEVWSKGRLLDIATEVEGRQQKEHSNSSNLIVQAVKFTRGAFTGIAADYASCLKLIISNKQAAEMSLYVLPGEMDSIKAVECQLIDNCLQRGDIIHILTLQAVDAYGNAVEKGRQITLELCGLELQDSQGTTRPVDEHGCIILGGLLKVTGPFNSKARIYLHSEKHALLYVREFNLLQRSLHIKSLIPNEANAGGTLQNIKIEIHNENGQVDKKMDGPHHMIMLDACRHAYPLKQGICCIDTIQLPNKPGMWCCRVYHSMNSELEAEIKVNVVCAPPAPPNAFTPEEEVLDNDPLLRIHDTSGWISELTTKGKKIIQKLEKLQNQMKTYASKVQKTEAELCELQTKKDIERNQISRLQGEIKTLDEQAKRINLDELAANNITDDFDQMDFTVDKVAKSIISTVNHPARFFMEAKCPGNFLSQEAGSPGFEEILGLVSLLASVQNQLLSKALAEFIGQENMLAVVCKTRRAASLIERYNGLDGKVDESWGLHKFTKSQSKSVHGRLRVYILQEMTLYDCGYDRNHSQKILKIEAPQLNTGACPEGFLGYAVNLLYINEDHLSLRLSNEGQGLRGSLFYHLFKKLQVYDTRKHLLDARHVLISGGISLDGGLIREKGCEDFGRREEADVIFPVISKLQKCGMRLLPPEEYQHMQIENALHAKKLELKERSSLVNDIEARVLHVRQKHNYYEKLYEETKEEIKSQTQEKVQLQEQLNLRS